MKEISELIDRSENIVILTGAGVSTDSGIPDFQTVDENWKYELSRQEVLSIPFFRENPELFWELYRDLVFIVEKNKFHRFSEELSKEKNVQIFTQNTDGLHTGDNVTEMHGRRSRVICMNRDCDFGVEDLSRFSETAPRCPKCNEILKPDVSLFLEGIEGFSAARDAIVDCDLLIVAGTSLNVGPVNELPLYLHWMRDDNVSIWINKESPPPEYEFDYEYLDGATEFVEELSQV